MRAWMIKYNKVALGYVQGLQMLEKDTEKVVTLASEAPLGKTGEGVRPIHCANDLAIASDGSIYFTDSTEIPTAINPAGFYDPMASFLLAAFQVAHATAPVPSPYARPLALSHTRRKYIHFYPIQ